jgi:hypothetical protein
MGLLDVDLAGNLWCKKGQAAGNRRFSYVLSRQQVVLAALAQSEGHNHKQF